MIDQIAAAFLCVIWSVGFFAIGFHYGSQCGAKGVIRIAKEIQERAAKAMRAAP